MKDYIDLVTSVVALNGGRMVGKTRLQKTIFLLEAAGLGAEIDFDYHHYGPYSADIASAVDDAVDVGRLRPEVRFGYHEVPYTIYSTDAVPSNRIGALSAAEVQRLLAALDSYSALELEVAATIVYLRDNGYGERAVEETKLRKPAKATDARVRRALRLIDELGLDRSCAAPFAAAAMPGGR